MPEPFMVVGDRWNKVWNPPSFGVTKVALVEGDTNFASLAHRLGWFKSASEARKQGWNQPIGDLGSFKVGKRTIEIEPANPC